VKVVKNVTSVFVLLAATVVSSLLLDPSNSPSPLTRTLDPGALLAGMKVHGFVGGRSEADVPCIDCDPGVPVPEPAGLIILGTGMFLLARQVRRWPRRRSVARPLVSPRHEEKSQPGVGHTGPIQPSSIRV